MSITQDQLAAHLGVSRQSVVRALHGKGQISERTRQRILEAARELGYSEHSNQEARALIARRYGKRVRHNLVALIMSGVEGGLMRDAPYYEPIFHGIEEEAVARNIDVTMHAFRAGHVPQYVREKRVDGVISFASSEERNQWLHEIGLPVVSIGGVYHHTSGLMADDYEGIRLATQHLIDLGHTRIAFLGFEIALPDYLRLRAFRDTMAKNHLPVHDELVEATVRSHMMQSGGEGLQRLLARSRDFTALVCHNDTFAMGAIEQLRANGLDVPRDVSVTGFDDISPACRFEPAITSVRFDRHAMGRRVIAVSYELLDQIEAAPADTPIPLYREVFPVEFVVRDSTRKLA